jgi:hypothetical protein
MCKFLTYLTKFLKIEDLNEIDGLLRELILNENLGNSHQNENKFNLVDNKLTRQTKASIGGYIYDILKDNENFKHEGLCFVYFVSFVSILNAF